MFAGSRLRVFGSIFPHAALVLVGLTALVLSGTATGTTPCEQQVLRDWADNGRIDGVYPLPCYGAAIDILPADLRDYTNAAEVIERALTAALRSAPSPAEGDPERALADGVGAASVEAGSSGPGVVLLLSAAVSIAALAGILGGYPLLRRRRRRSAPS